MSAQVDVVFGMYSGTGAFVAVMAGLFGRCRWRLLMPRGVS